MRDRKSKFMYGFHTVRQVVFELRWIPQSCSCSSDEASQQLNGRRRSVPTTKWMATKFPGDKTAVTKQQRRKVLLHPGILGISRDCPGRIHVFSFIPKYLVSWDTWEIQGWSQMHSSLSSYPEIPSILEYSRYPGMVPDASMYVPFSRNN